MTAEKLGELSVQSLVIVATGTERARLYFRFRPPRCPVGADPDLVTHKAYGVPQTAKTPEITKIIHSRWTDLARELQLQVPAGQLYEALNRRDGFAPAETDAADRERHQVQFVGQFLVDRDGIVRWIGIECAQEGVAGLDKFPTEEEVLAAARLLSG
jgi:hypothetical protein